MTERVLEQQPDDAGRDRAHHEQPAQPRVGVVRRDLAQPQRAEDAAHDPHPVVPEEAEQHERGGEVRCDQEREEEVVVLVNVPAEQPRQDHGVAEARDREELGEALEEPQHDGLEVRDQGGADDHHLTVFSIGDALPSM